MNKKEIKLEYKRNKGALDFEYKTEKTRRRYAHRVCKADLKIALKAAPKDQRKEAKQALKNLANVLAEAGMTMADVVKTTVFIKDMNDFAKVNAVYAEAFGANKSARSCVEVARLPKDGLVEIEVIALKK